MPFVRPTLQEINNRIQTGIESRLFGKTALLKRAVLRILSRVFAGVIHTCYGYLQSLIDQFFVTTATGSFLERLGKMWGISRKAASFATGEAVFTGTISETLPVDTRIQSGQGIEYGTTVATFFDSGSKTIEIQAVEAGEDANLTVTTPVIFDFVSPVPNFNDTATVNDNITGGVNEETDEDLRDRILFRIQEPPMGGNATDYIRWTTSIEGVDQAWSYPLAYGPGTVAIAFTAEGTDPIPSSALISNVTGYLEEQKPVGANVTVETITVAQFGYVIYINPINTEFEAAIEANLESLLYAQKPGALVRISQVRGAISASGITDYDITLFQVNGVNKPVSDFQLLGYDYPVLQIVAFFEKTW